MPTPQLPAPTSQLHTSASQIHLRSRLDAAASHQLSGEFCSYQTAPTAATALLGAVPKVPALSPQQQARPASQARPQLRSQIPFQARPVTRVLRPISQTTASPHPASPHPASPHPASPHLASQSAQEQQEACWRDMKPEWSIPELLCYNV